MSQRSHPCLMAVSTAVLLFTGAATCAGGDDRTGGRRPTAPPKDTPFLSRQHVDAHVTKVDQRDNTLTLKTDVGKLHIEAPAAAIATLEKGDPLLLEIGILRAPVSVRADERSHREPGAESVLVRRRLTARILEVDQNAGRLRLKMSGGIIRLDLPSNVLAAFKRHEMVPIELSVVRAAAGQALADDDPERSRRAGLAALLFAIFGKKSSK